MSTGGKYAHIYPPVTERLNNEEALKHKTGRERVKAVKKRFHLLYGAYAGGHTHKFIDGLLNNLTAETLDAYSAQIMRLHASARERLPLIDAFYDFIYRHTGDISSAADIGCGFNPFALPFMPFRASLKIYHACDIDVTAAALLNRYFDFLDLPRAAFCADIAVETPVLRAEAAFLFKLLPVLEAQRKGRGGRLINELGAEVAVVTYPLKSLGGREKGMGAHYAGVFEHMLNNELTAYKLAAKQAIGGELVYIIRKK